jgi:hypothetical protein
MMANPRITAAGVRFSITETLKQAVKVSTNIHRADGRPNVFLFSTPRSGSTWLMELIWSQPGFKYCNEPLNLRQPLVRQYLGMSDWREVCNQDAEAALYHYFYGFCTGRLHFKNVNPLRRYYRPLTHRIVFKLLHGGEDRINWLRDTFNGRIVYLIRHPIPVSLSREAFPRLEAFLDSDYRRHFTAAQLQVAQKIRATGTKLEHGILAWCCQNAVLLRQATADWAIVSYEQLIRDPAPVVAYLADKLALPKPERMLRRLAVPSASKRKSDQETQAILDSGTTPRSMLVEKWQRRIDAAQERRVMEILERFEVDVYHAGDVLPADWVWIKSETAT